MNLGVYLESIGMQDKMAYTKDIFEFGRKHKLVKDTSLFYDSPQKNYIDLQCGMFNSTDIWNFSGTLITYSIQTTKSAINIVNNFNIIYCFGWEENINIFDVLDIINKVKPVSKNKICQDELFRITGVHSKLINEPRDFFYE